MTETRPSGPFYHFTIHEDGTTTGGRVRSCKDCQDDMCDLFPILKLWRDEDDEDG